jgi:hypothetical protein
MLLRRLELCSWQRILPVKDVICQPAGATRLVTAAACGLESNLVQQGGTQQWLTHKVQSFSSRAQSSRESPA